MATYTKSTGYDLKNVTAQTTYNVKQTLYTVPAGKFAILGQCWIRCVNSSNSLNNINHYINKIGNGDSWEVLTAAGTGFTGTSQPYKAVYENSISPWGVTDATGQNVTGSQAGPDADSLRYLREGESVLITQNNSPSTELNVSLEIYEFTSQV